MSENELEKLLKEAAKRVELTPEETILANYQETFFRLCRSGFTYKQATEAMCAFSDPDNGPEEAI